MTEMIKLGAVAGSRKQFNALGPLAYDHSDVGGGCSIKQGSSEDEYHDSDDLCQNLHALVGATMRHRCNMFFQL